MAQLCYGTSTPQYHPNPIQFYHAHEYSLPPAPPQPHIHPFYISEYSSPSCFYQYNDCLYTAPQVFDEMTVKNFSPTSPYILSIQTTLSSGQIYYALEPTTVFDNANSFGELSPGSESLNIGCETEVAKINMKIVGEADEFHSRIETETKIAYEVEAINKIGNEIELISETEKNLEVVMEEKVVMKYVPIDPVKEEDEVKKSSEKKSNKQKSKAQPSDQAKGVSKLPQPKNLANEVTSGIVINLNSQATFLLVDSSHGMPLQKTLESKFDVVTTRSLLEVMKFDPSHDWGDAKPAKKNRAHVQTDRPCTATKGQKGQLLTNYFKVKLTNIDRHFSHYSVSMFYEDGHLVAGKGIGTQVMDCIQDPYRVELEGKELAYDNRSLITFGALLSNKVEFTVALEVISLIKSNGNCSPDRANENDRKRIRHTCHSKTYILEISSVPRIPMHTLLQVLQGLNYERSQEVLRVLNIILRQHVAKQGCLLNRQSYFHNSISSFTDVGGGVLSCHGFHSSVRTTQDDILLNIDVSINMIIQHGNLVGFLIAIQNVQDNVLAGLEKDGPLSDAKATPLVEGLVSFLSDSSMFGEVDEFSAEGIQGLEYMMHVTDLDETYNINLGHTATGVDCIDTKGEIAVDSIESKEATEGKQTENIGGIGGCNGKSQLRTPTEHIPCFNDPLFYLQEGNFLKSHDSCMIENSRLHFAVENQIYAIEEDTGDVPSCEANPIILSMPNIGHIWGFAYEDNFILEGNRVTYVADKKCNYLKKFLNENSFVNQQEKKKKLLRQMVAVCMEPSVITISSVLSACRRMTTYKNGREIHGYLLKSRIIMNLRVQNALTDIFYGKPEWGVDLYWELLKSSNKDIDWITHAAVLYACRTAIRVEVEKSFCKCIRSPKVAFCSLMVARLACADSNQFLAVCLDTSPPIFYMNDTSHKIISCVEKWKRFEGTSQVAYTFDVFINFNLLHMINKIAVVRIVFEVDKRVIISAKISVKVFDPGGCTCWRDDGASGTNCRIHILEDKDILKGKHL